MKKRQAITLKDVVELEQVVGTLRHMVHVKSLVEVGVILRDHLGWYAEQYVERSVVFSYPVEVWVGLLLDGSECLARPSLVDNASSFRSTPGAASIAFAIEFLLFGIVPNTK